MGAAASVATDSSERMARLQLCFSYMTNELKIESLSSLEFAPLSSRDDGLFGLLFLYVKLYIPIENRCHDFIDSEHYQLDVSDLRGFDFSTVTESINIVGECCNLSNLGFLKTINPQQKAKIFGISILSNNIDDGNLFCGIIPTEFPYLRQLKLGGNPLESVMRIAGVCPISLCSLDLSYSENLVFEKNCFANCPQLISLTLDGCGLSSTLNQSSASISSGDPMDNESFLGSKSIFFGLVSLEKLSLKENELSDLDELLGLTYFDFESKTASSEILTVLAAKMGLKSTLQHLWLTENPIWETSADKKHVVRYLSRISSLLTIDSVSLINSTMNNSLSQLGIPIQMNKLMQNRPDQALDPNLEGLEKEYLSALKGEKDTAIIR